MFEKKNLTSKVNMMVKFRREFKYCFIPELLLTELVVPQMWCY